MLWELKCVLWRGGRKYQPLQRKTCEENPYPAETSFHEDISDMSPSSLSGLQILKYFCIIILML